MSIAIALVAAAMAFTAGTASASGDGHARHRLPLADALSAAREVAEGECAPNPSCLGYSFIPCIRSGKHGYDCMIHNIIGLIGDQAQQQDCHREAHVFIGKRGFRVRFFWIDAAPTCGPNSEHEGFRAPR